MNMPIGHQVAVLAFAGVGIAFWGFLWHLLLNWLWARKYGVAYLIIYILAWLKFSLMAITAVGMAAARSLGMSVGILLIVLVWWSIVLRKAPKPGALSGKSP